MRIAPLNTLAPPPPYENFQWAANFFPYPVQRTSNIRLFLIIFLIVLPIVLGLEFSAVARKLCFVVSIGHRISSYLTIFHHTRLRKKKFCMLALWNKCSKRVCSLNGKCNVGYFVRHFERQKITNKIDPCDIFEKTFNKYLNFFVFSRRAFQAGGFLVDVFPFCGTRIEPTLNDFSLIILVNSHGTIEPEE